MYVFNIRCFDLIGDYLLVECLFLGYVEFNEFNRYWSNYVGGIKYCDFYVIISN